MMTKLTPKVLDERGNLNLHTQQGVRIRFNFTDDNGVALSMVGRNVVMEVNNATRVTLTAGATDDELILEIPQGQFNTLVNRAVPFVILDETTGVHELLMEGQLSVRGWV